MCWDTGRRTSLMRKPLSWTLAILLATTVLFIMPPVRTTGATTGGERTKGAARTHINAVDDAPMVYVPAGEFVMGSRDSFTDAKPQHRVYLDGYWIYQTPVTVRQYRRFC